MKKFLAILLAFVLAFSLVACSSNVADEETLTKEDRKNPEEEATEAVEEFMDAYVELDADEMEDFVVDKDDLPEFLNITVDDLVAPAVQYEIANPPFEEFKNYEKDLEKAYIALIENAMDELSYEITEVEENDDEFTFTVEVTVFDSEIMKDIDLNSLTAEKYTQEYLMKLAAEAGKDIATLTETEFMEIYLPDYFKFVLEVFADAEIKTHKEEIEVVVKHEDDEWLIDAKNSDLDDLELSFDFE